MVQKCGFNIEELNFGEINEPKNKTFILYNYSDRKSLNFDFMEPGFLIKDELIIQPNRGLIDAGKYKLIKCILNPATIYNSEYEGDILVRISWNNEDDNMLFPKSPKKKNVPKNINSSFIGNNAALSKIHNIPRENIYLRIVKKGIITEKFGNLIHKETTTNNSSFVEILLKDLTKQILCSNEFKNIFTQRVKEQPLSLYKWTNNQSLPSLGKLRKKYIDSLKLLVLSQVGDLSSDPRSKRKTMMDSRLNYSKITNSQTHSSNKNSSKQKTSSLKMPFLDIPLMKEQEEYNDSLDNKIQEKYLKDLSVKYKYSIKEINEKIIMINDETRKLISNIIMENTIYNIINQTVYGEIDLTVKPRIYFFLGKDSNFKVSESANKGSVQGSMEIKNENNLLQSQNSGLDKYLKEENNNKENDKNSRINTSRKEENKNNNSIASKNSKKSAVKNS